jgi:hypothetical protein
VEYIANVKRIKGESQNIFENVPKKEPETHFTAEIAEDAESSSHPSRASRFRRAWR